MCYGKERERERERELKCTFNPLHSIMEPISFDRSLEERERGSVRRKGARCFDDIQGFLHCILRVKMREREREKKIE